MPGLGQLHGGLDGMLAERVHRHAHASGFHARAIGAHPDADVMIDDALNGDQDFHAVLQPVGGVMTNLGGTDKPREWKFGPQAGRLLEKGAVGHVPASLGMYRRRHTDSVSLEVFAR